MLLNFCYLDQGFLYFMPNRFFFVFGVERFSLKTCHTRAGPFATQPNLAVALKGTLGTTERITVGITIRITVGLYVIV